MRAKLVVPAAVAAWMLCLAAPHGARADLPIKPLDSKDQYSLNSDPWVPDNKDPRKIIAVPDQQPADQIDRNARLERLVRVYLYWERFLRAYRIGGVAR
jgi:hypothetical protein